MRVRLATPAGAVLLSCLVLAGCTDAPGREPAYPAITAAFSAAFLNIVRGGDVRRALGAAVGRIDRNLAAHRYQPSEP
jgi:hypothetical protein